MLIFFSPYFQAAEVIIIFNCDPFFFAIYSISPEVDISQRHLQLLSTLLYSQMRLFAFLLLFW